ncbi:MAG: M15 family metallopeptidase [Polyangiales bacterium]
MESVTVTEGGPSVSVPPPPPRRRTRAELIFASVASVAVGAMLAGSALGVSRASGPAEAPRVEAPEAPAVAAAHSQEADPEDAGDGVMDELDDTPPTPAAAAPAPRAAAIAGAIADATPRRRSSRMVTSDDVPEGPTLGYVHGRAIRVVVTRLDGKPVEVHTAAAFRRMREAATRDRVAIRIVSGFRTMEHQQALYRAYRRGQGNLAALPGHSNHQSGRALDLNTSSAGVLRWLERNGRRFGFRRTVPNEPWHWEFR